MTQSKVKFIYFFHCVSTNVTPYRMLENWFQISQIDRLFNRFQNMYDIQFPIGKIWPFGREIQLGPKKNRKTPKINTL